jgi:hypothetical protein
MFSLVYPETPAHFDGSVGVPEKMLTAATQSYKQSSRFLGIQLLILQPFISGLFCRDREAAVFEVCFESGFLT